VEMSEVLQHLDALPPATRRQVEDEALEATAHRRWVPSPGPQTDAFFCEADELLFGGEAGGGKTDLIIGLSITEHSRSLVLRRTNKEAEKLFDRYEEIIGNRFGMNSQKGWRLDSRVIDIGGCQLENDKQKRKGIPHDLKAFDELVDFSESQYEFIITWNRSTDPNQRCRIVATTNPPTRPEGMWVVKRWAPWLDPSHPNPAETGELRWFTTIDGKDTEVDGPGPHDDGTGQLVMARSRTFIRSRLKDNPDLTQTGDYAARLAALPRELRDAYASGKFEAGLKDAPFQAVPTEWIREAQGRWTEKPPAGVPMCGIGVDMSGGSHDPMIIAPRYDGYFPKLIEIAAKDIPADRPGKFAAGMVMSYRRNNAIVVVDLGGGHGGGCYEQLKDNLVSVVGHSGMKAAVQRTADGQLRFANLRTQVIWRFREALDPSQPTGSPISLPPDPTLLADLAAPTFWHANGVLHIEAKVDVVKRLKRSTDRGDAVCMAWSAGPTYLTDGESWRAAAEAARPLGRQPQVVMGRQHAVAGRRNG
jgi:hypothetical protein